MSSIIESVFATAKTYLGVREATGRNDGPQVARILAKAGLDPNNRDPWCAAWVFVVLDEAGVKGWPREVYCPRIWSWAKSKGILVDGLKASNGQGKIPEAGDVILMLDNEGPQGAYHIGIVLDVNEDRKTVATIEGNTNKAGSPEGDGVYVKERAWRDADFVRWANLPGQVESGVTGIQGDIQLVVKVQTAGGFTLIPCNPVNESGRIRGDVSAIARALGYEVRWIPPGRVELFRPEPKPAAAADTKKKPKDGEK